jgi:hypothetical protein
LRRTHSLRRIRLPLSSSSFRSDANNLTMSPRTRWNFRFQSGMSKQYKRFQPEMWTQDERFQSEIPLQYWTVFSVRNVQTVPTSTNDFGSKYQNRTNVVSKKCHYSTERFQWVNIKIV